ncbi:MAG: hypothetical protein ACI8VC_001190 [Candidatus Endobugula sp.]|jgi:uncharacterized protein (TIGR02099 family)
MSSSLRFCLRYAGYILSVAIISTALLLQSARLLAPHLHHVTASIESFISEKIQMDTTIGHIEAQWHGLIPHLIINDIAMRSNIADNIPAKETLPPLSIKYIEIKLDLLASIIRLKWEWKKIVLSNANITLTQSQEGTWSVVGYPLFTTHKVVGSGWERSDLIYWANQIPDIHINNVLVNARSASAQQVQFFIPSINTQTNVDSDFQRLVAEVQINNLPAVSLVIERQSVTGANQQDGVNTNTDTIAYLKGFLSASNISFDTVQKLFYSSFPGFLQRALQQDQQLINTYAGGTLWFDFLANDSISMLAKSEAVASSSYLDGQQPLVISSLLQAELNQENALTLSLDQLMFDGEDILGDIALLSGKQQSTLQIERVALKPLVSWVNNRFLLPNKVSRVEEILAAQGELRYLTFDINHKSIDQSTLSATAKNLSFNSFDNIPAMGNVNGYIETQWLSGFIDIESEKVHFSHEKFHDEPIIFNQLSGQVAWSFDTLSHHLTVSSHYLRGNADFGEAVGEFLLDIPLKQDNQESELSVQIGLKNSEIRYHQLLIPNKVSGNVRQWLAGSLQSGNVEQAGFVYRGGFSGDDSTRSVQLFAEVSDVDLDYSQDWPVLENVKGQLLVDNDFLHVSTSQAEIYQEPLETLSVTWPGNGRHILHIRSAGKLSAKTGLRLLTETAIKERVGSALDGVNITGNIQTDIDLWVPVGGPPVNTSSKIIENSLVILSTETPTKDLQLITVEFLNNNVSLLIPSLPVLNMSALAGKLSYSTDRGLQATNVAMQIFGKPLNVKLDTVPVSLTSPRKRLIITGEGIAPVTKIMSWLKRPELKVLSGKTPYQFSLSTAFQIDTDVLMPVSVGKSTFNVSSSLQGVSIDLPEPFNKDTVSARETIFSGSFSDLSSQYHLTMGKDIMAELLQKGSVSSGFLSVGKPSLSPVADNVFLISAKMKNFDVEEWLNKSLRFDFFRGDSSSPPVKLLYDISIGSMNIEQHELSNIRFVGERSAAQWRTQIENELISAEMTIYDDESVPTNLSINYLNILKKSKKTALATSVIDPLKEVDLSWLKPMDVNIDKLSYNKKKFGQWRFSINPTAEGIAVDNIHAALGSMRLHGKSTKDGASLFWRTRTKKVESEKIDLLESLSRTEFSGRLQGDGVDELFTAMGVSPVLSSRETFLDADITWSGSPMAFSVLDLDGTLGIKFNNGAFIQDKESNTTGILRLLGLFNFNTWARRLRFDFSDFYSKGLAYDNMSAQLVFDQAKIYFQQPLVVKAPSSEFTMAGKINYKAETIDAVLVTTLPVGGNLTFATALVAGLPTALGVFIFNKIFKSQVDKVSSLTYSVKGDWREPKVKFLNIFDYNLYSGGLTPSETPLAEPGIN